MDDTPGVNQGEGPEGAQDRPLVTFALFAYNQEKYIREAVEGAFAQTYQPLEIILSDDCSTDRTFEIMREMVAAYRGPHIVRLRKSDQNLGVASHFSAVLEVCNSDYVVLAAGDDISLPHRATLDIKILERHNDVSFIESSQRIFFDKDEKNIWAGRDWRRVDGEGSTQSLIFFSLYDYMQGLTPELVGAARTIRRSRFQIYGSLKAECPTEDTPSILRLLISGRGCKHDKISILRRMHGQNLSHPQSLAKMQLDKIFDQYAEDIHQAEKLGFINRDDYKNIKMWARKNIKKRVLITELHWGSGGLFLRLIRFLFSREFPIKQKFGQIRFLLNRVR